MSSSDSDSDSSSNNSECNTGWPWKCNHHIENFSDDESDSSFESISDESSDEETIDDLWTNRRNIFISVYKSDNFKNTTLITNYNELHNYREKCTKLSKKSVDNIKNIWSQVKVNVPDLGIVTLKSYEKEMIQYPNNKNKTVEKPTSIPKQTETIVDKTESPFVTQNQSSKEITKPDVASNQTNRKVVAKAGNKAQAKATNITNKNIKENNINEKTKSKENHSKVKIENKENETNQKKIGETLIKVTKSTEGNKTSPVNGSTTVYSKDKDAKVDFVVPDVPKSESDKKNVKIQSTHFIKLNESDKNSKNSSNESESQIKFDCSKNKAGKRNSAKKSKKTKQKNSNSQSSENSDILKRSSSMDSCSKTPVKEKAKKKIEESDNDTTDEVDEHEEIIDNMDALTGHSKVIVNEKFQLVKHKDKKKAIETPNTSDKKINLKNNNEQNVAGSSSMLNNLDSPTLEKSYVFYSDKFADESVDMMMANNLMGGLESLTRAMQYNPGDDRHYLNRCYCYLRLNKSSLALADAQYLLQTTSHLGHRFIAYLRAGQASMALQKYAQAENYFKDSLSINPDNLYAQREFIRAKISRIVNLDYTERDAVLALLKYSKTQEAISYLANKNIANSKNESNNYKKSFDDIDDLDDLVYSSDEDDKPNCTTLINSMINYEPNVTKLFHLLSKPVNLSSSASYSKNTNGDNYKKNISNGKSNTRRVMEKTIWVGSLRKDITEAVLKKYFKQFGTIISIYCPPHEAYAFVNFEKPEHAANALKKPSGHEINGVKLVVSQGTCKK